METRDSVLFKQRKTKASHRLISTFRFYMYLDLAKTSFHMCGFYVSAAIYGCASRHTWFRGYVGMTSLQVKVHSGRGECFGLYRCALIIFERE